MKSLDAAEKALMAVVFRDQQRFVAADRLAHEARKVDPEWAIIFCAEVLCAAQRALTRQRQDPRKGPGAKD